MSHTSGSLFRCTINAVPFLLPLLFQDGFGWTAVKSGAVLLALFAGNLGIKPLTTPILRRLGFRSVLVAADVVAALTMVACGLLADRTPLVAILALLVTSGAARSVGFTAYTTIAFADIEPEAMRHANTIASTAQQVAIGVGAALGAVAVRFGAWTTPALGAGSATPAYRTAFMIIAAITLAGAVQALRLRRDGGAELLAARPGTVSRTA